MAFSPLRDNLSTKSLMEKVNLETNRAKKSLYPLFFYILFKYIVLPGIIYKPSLAYFNTIFHAVITNVPVSINYNYLLIYFINTIFIKYIDYIFLSRVQLNQLHLQDNKSKDLLQYHHNLDRLV
jgi:hypothetical protein